MLFYLYNFFSYTLTYPKERGIGAGNCIGVQSQGDRKAGSGISSQYF
jgi:hypothetical protein